MEFSNYTISVLGLFKKRFEVFENGELVFLVKQGSLLNTRRFLFEDHDGHLIFTIYRPSFINTGRFEILEDDAVLADISRKLVNNHFFMASGEGNFEVTGNLLGTKYNILKEGQEIGFCSRKIFKRKGQYGLAIQKNQDTDLLLAFILTVAISNQLRRNSG